MQETEGEPGVCTDTGVWVNWGEHGHIVQGKGVDHGHVGHPWGVWVHG